MLERFDCQRRRKGGYHGPSDFDKKLNCIMQVRYTKRHTHTCILKILVIIDFSFD